MKAFALLAAAVLVVIGVGAGVVGGLHPGLDDAIAQYAVDAAASNGNPDPATVSWVVTNRNAANSLLLSATVGSTDPVYAMEITGGRRFVLSGPVQHGSRPRPAPVLVLVVQRSDFFATDLGVLPRLISLKPLGRVHTESLVGLTPMNFTAWQAIFGG